MVSEQVLEGQKSLGISSKNRGAGQHLVPLSQIYHWATCRSHYLTGWHHHLTPNSVHSPSHPSSSGTEGPSRRVQTCYTNLPHPPAPPHHCFGKSGSLQQALGQNI